MPRFFSFLLIVTILTLSACKKLEVGTNSGTNTPANSGQGSSTTTGPRLSYGDTLFFNHSLATDKLVPTLSVPAGTVKYKAIPLGLSLDTVTGRINVTKSESGVRYKVFAINNAGIVLDSVKLVVSGIDYRDEIFVLQSTPTAYDTSFPVYNARPGLALPCSGDDDDDDDESCVFDETDLDNDGNDDIAGIIQDKLLVDKKTGTIDIEASFNAGIFGSSTPVNGMQKDFLMYYRLNDASNKALQKINIRVYYFNRRSDIPQALLNELAQRSNQQAAVNARTEYSFSNYSSFEKPKRPPILIIVNTL